MSPESETSTHPTHPPTIFLFRFGVWFLLDYRDLSFLDVPILFVLETWSAAVILGQR